MSSYTHVHIQTLPMHYTDSVAYWYTKAKILWIELNSVVGGKRTPTPFHASVNAPNVTQIALDLSLAKEVLAIEIIGAHWSITYLKEPIVSKNLSLSIDLTNWLPLNPGLSNKSFYIDCDQSLTLETNVQQTLFRICLNNTDQIVSDYISASPHLIYGITNEILQEIWVIRPNEEVLQ